MNELTNKEICDIIYANTNCNLFLKKNKEKETNIGYFFVDAKSELIKEKKTIKIKTPQGRSLKQHNIILDLNKKNKF